jgi:formylglycine-generating enzyme required for sulfatase activity
LSNETGKSYRLLSEAEWEYAVRSGTTTRYSWGDEITPANANYNESAHKNKMIEVGSYPPNAWGLFDMHGNVREWCADVWHDSYEGAPTDGSAWLEGGDQDRRVLCGGSWYFYPGLLRSAGRDGSFAGVRNVGLSGFRVARTLR